MVEPGGGVLPIRTTIPIDRVGPVPAGAVRHPQLASLRRFEKLHQVRQLLK